MDKECDQIAGMLWRYLDKVLKPKDIDDLEMHLEACSGCKGHMEFEKAARRFLKEKFDSMKAPARLRELIESALSR